MSAGKQVTGYVLACTSTTEKECLDRMLFGTNKLYGDNVLKIRKGELVFLININSDKLFGPFTADSDGEKNIVPEAWKGRYPYQVKVAGDNFGSIRNARKVLKQISSTWREPISPDNAAALVEHIKNPKSKVVFRNEQDDKPRRESTTLWDYPKQSYGKTPKGSNKYAGVTPAFIIYNMVRRYTDPGDLVLDPMSGSGTTLDVCKEEGRRCAAFDIAPPRPEVLQSDARKIPLADSSVDMVFIDSPYGDNIDYNDQAGNIGRLSAETDEFYDELEKVMVECHRVLKPGKVIGWLIGDQWVKKKFTPVGFNVYDRLCRHFETVDIICVARRGQTSNTGIWHNRALRFNFYLRGFKYLFIMRKTLPEKAAKRKKVSWKQYQR
ncbi:MAG: DNA methylase [Nitrososphaera sp.]|nr:DNA methylase [Nitrososphaera sp.]